jgi:PBP1b-binding outer membrane lipoprotein LpoB
MKIILISILLLAGCASFDPEVEKSVSRDRTAESMAKAAIIGEMLKSSDPLVRAKGAEAADKFVNEKKNIFGF